MTITTATGAAAPPARTPRRRPSPGWVPAMLLLSAATGLLCWSGVPVGEVAAFAGYIGIGVLLPGTLLWRALGCGGGSLPAELAAGLALGYAIEVLAYIPTRAAGLPLLTPVWSVAVLAAFLAIPGLRRHWRGGGRRVPVWWSWAVALIGGYLLVWSALPFYRSHGLTPPGNGSPYVDLPYHLALLGELKHHMPPTLPVALGERLSYHWFVYAEMSATSWITGIEPQTLLYRLSALPILAASVVLIPVIAWRLTRCWWPGVAALVSICFTSSPELHHGPPLFTGRPLFTTWLSPTQNFGTMLFAALILLLTQCLTTNDPTTGRAASGYRDMECWAWMAVPVLLLALTGAKATFLPLLLGGLTTALAVRRLLDRRFHLRTLAGIGLTLACFAFAQVVVFGGARQGMTIEPLHTMRRIWRVAAQLTMRENAATPPTPLLVLTLVFLACLTCVYGGLFGLASKRGTLPDPAMPTARRVVPHDSAAPAVGRGGLRDPAAPAVRSGGLRDPVLPALLGIGGSGVVAVLVLGHPAVSQLYFLESARPYLSIAAAVGLWVLVATRTVSWRWPAAALVSGAVLAVAASAFGASLPVRDPWALALPYLVLGVVTVAFWLVRRPAGLVMVALAAGYTVPSVNVSLAPFRPVGPGVRTVPEGALEAGRWLRDHSEPDDVVATNVHCRLAPPNKCDSRHFWVSAYSERRVLIEGWAYAESTLARAPRWKRSYLRIPYRDQSRLAANDAAFAQPSLMSRFVREYGVSWLLVERADPALNRYAKLRFRAGVCSVYEV